MITDKDREDAKIICSSIKIPIELSIGGLKIVTTVSTGEILAKLNSETIAQILYGIRAESAEQARKEAAERVASAWREHGEDITLRMLRESILGDSARVSTEGEKLAIAVKALEEIKQIRKAGPAFESHFSKLQDIGRITNDALKEIQG